MRIPAVTIVVLAAGAVPALAGTESPDAAPVGAYQISAGGGAGVWRLDTRTGALSYCWVHNIADALAFVAEKAQKDDPFEAIIDADRLGLPAAVPPGRTGATPGQGIDLDRLGISREEIARLVATKKAGEPPPSVLVVSCSSGRQ
jgi:hypothetical protein